MSIDYDEQLRQKERQQMFTDSSKEEIDCYSLSEDICRICHMGGTLLSSNKNQSRSQPEEKQIRISAFSSYSYLGPLISACKCRGTVGLVHADCLERWLTESGHTRCELCGYKYTTKRIPRHSILRSLLIWFKTVVVTRQMFLDVLYLVVTTPLALFACYVCVIALKLLIESGFYQVPWVIVVMLPTCSLTLVAYWAWLMTLGRLHIRRWRRYWRNNFVVRLLPEDINNLANEQSIESTTIDDFYQEVENERMNDRRLIGTSL
ncbi:PREDICTED: E3 ubiquitin-protein ligase MARCH3-like isoform X2 [Polistes dominula]|uniref:E3 ubiquitin-protein ligase MARCH3-like isoform X2 n=1 Tax=Polistes dominula TaxID=743375 RepID=A0ABM1IH25_POLDO|nr:PREDICTED: E3 ubiquitin-protein ligase MARCH3-like isoform X2 [Polistes dominula]